MTASASISPPISSISSRDRRSFQIFGGNHFSFSRGNMVDLCVSACTTFVETIVYLLGPLLICFAATIIIGLSWVFFTIYIPMMKFALDKQEASPLRRYVEIGFNVGFVCFVLIEIIFNYYMCVTTRNSGPSSSYNAVARELAESTNFEYPDTPEEVAQYRRHFNDKMMVRVRRREARDAEQRHRMRSHSRCCDANGKCSGNKIPAVSHNTATGKTASTGHVADVELDQVPSNSNADVTLRKKARQNQPKKDSKQPGGHDGNANNTHTRSWMFMAPDEWGFCTKSNQPKPPRSHYDHVSKSLVMCLDHYCPWMFNAIGYFNYRYFLNFLIYVCVAMLYGAFISYRPFINSTGSVYRDQLLRYRKTGVWMYIHPYTPMPSERGPLTLGFMLCLAVGIAVACLGSFHVYLTLSGQTTIEFHGNFINRAKAKRRGEKYRNPYDMGWKRNWQQIYGDYGNTLSMVMAMVIPSRREPHFLPLPLGGEAGKRKHLRARDQDDGDEMTKPILGSTSNLSDAGNIV